MVAQHVIGWLGISFLTRIFQVFGWILFNNFIAVTHMVELDLSINALLLGAIIYITMAALASVIVRIDWDPSYLIMIFVGPIAFWVTGMILPMWFIVFSLWGSIGMGILYVLCYVGIKRFA